jgi:HD-GYP domain-containing protein (c-di-GMP phosphodiesterase class II)
MVRISDILKKKLGLTQDQPEVPPKEDTSNKIPSNTSDTAQPLGATGMQMAKAMSDPEVPLSKDVKQSDLNISKVMKELQPDKQRSKNLYVLGIDIAEDIANNVRQDKPMELSKAIDWIDLVVDDLLMKDKELLSLFYESTPENHLYGHMINVSIMSIEVGLGLGYNKSRLNKLGLAAFLMDVGMFKVENIVLQSRSTSEEEFSKIKQHPVYSAKILSQIKDVSELVVNAVKEHHERINGKGYPEGLKDTEISEYARIITVVDVYEALTHDRPNLKKISPHEAIKEMLYSGSASFDAKILKVLIDKIGIYPIGSWVELNSNEIGKVINVNDEFPLKPVINLLFDSSRSRLAETRLIDLSRQTNLFIKRPLSDDEVSRKIKREGGD